MILRPCTHCPLKPDCERRAAMRKRLKGTGLTSAGFVCPERNEWLPPGTRVMVFLEVEDGQTQGSFYEPPEPYWGEVAFNGTVMLHRKFKVLVWLDDMIEGHKHPVIRLWPDRLTKLSEPRREVCAECGKPEGEKNHGKWDCVCEDES